MINRAKEVIVLKRLLKQFPIVGLIGARQVGKTTLARQLLGNAKRGDLFDLEKPSDDARLEDPYLALEALRGLVVIDEVQRRPEIFPILRVLADRPKTPARFLILGSASPSLLKMGSETLAGRVSFHELSGFGLDEAGNKYFEPLWIRGGFPGSFLAKSNDASFEWRYQFINTFLTRDLPQLGITISANTLRRFWTMLAHAHGGIWNASDFGRSFGVADTTVRNYLDILTSALVVRQLQPWHENIKKRQIKSPKIYLSDTGLLHTLLNLRHFTDIQAHPKIGLSWEGFVISQIVRQLGVRWDECYFWGTHAGGELDLLVVRGKKRLGFEIKRTSAPKVTPSVRNALADLNLSSVDIVHGGSETFPLHSRVRAVAANRIISDIPPL